MSTFNKNNLLDLIEKVKVANNHSERIRCLSIKDCSNCGAYKYCPTWLQKTHNKLSSEFAPQLGLEIDNIYIIPIENKPIKIVFS